MVDVLTKPLVKGKFVKSQDKLGWWRIPSLLAGSVEVSSIKKSSTIAWCVGTWKKLFCSFSDLCLLS